MASSESDSLPVSSAVQSTKLLREPIQTTEKWRWKFFFTLRADGSALRASMHCLWQWLYHYKIVHSPSTFLGLPLGFGLYKFVGKLLNCCFVCTRNTLRRYKTQSFFWVVVGGHAYFVCYVCYIPQQHLRRALWQQDAYHSSLHWWSWTSNLVTSQSVTRQHETALHAAGLQPVIGTQRNTEEYWVHLEMRHWWVGGVPLHHIHSLTGFLKFILWVQRVNYMIWRTLRCTITLKAMLAEVINVQPLV